MGTYQCDLDSTIINFYAENVIPGTGDPGMIYWQPDAGSGPRTSGTILNFHVKNYKGDNEIMEYMNGKSGNAGKINVRIDNYHYTGTGDFFFNNGSTVDLFDTLYITGNYYATVPFFSGGNYAYNTVFRNANIFCNQSGPVILSATGTGQPISIEHSVLSNNGSGPIIDFASAKTIKTHGSYTYGPNQLDAQVFFQKRRELGDYRYNGTAFGTTDGSGDLVVTLPATMPNATYTVLLTPGATTFQNVVTTAQNTTTFTARFFDAAGAAITSTGVVLNWMVIDY